MEDRFKPFVYLITIFLDMILIFILIFYKLNLFDKLWIFFIFIFHGLFYYALFYNKIYLLDILHYLIFIFIILSIFTKNIFLKLLSLMLLLLIQILWIKENRCILNEEDTKFGYGKELNYFVIIFTIILSINIGCYYEKINNSIYHFLNYKSINIE
tara:strand:- start:1779 stop:2246 length:468 start_codon:yes stop_codon:yes gene_type:complete